MGMSLIEVMVVMAVMTLIGLGTASLMKNMFSVQRSAALKLSVWEIQKNLVTILKNDASWAGSLNNAANVAILGCLRDSPVPVTGCNNGQTGNNFVIHDRRGGAWYNPILPNTGFAVDGTVCNTFSAVLGAGDDSCPFRFEVAWTGFCPGGVGPCEKPQVTLALTLIYNPGDPSDPRNRLNVADYALTFPRNERLTFEPFEIRHVRSGGAGGGACASNSWNNPRPLTNILYDQANNVTLAGTRFTVQPGAYRCKISAQGYRATSGFSIRLWDVTNSTAFYVGGGFANAESTTYAMGTVNFRRANPTVFELQHFSPNCSAGGFSMGRAAPTDTVLTSISCVRSS